jgi:hypothetical protein
MKHSTPINRGSNAYKQVVVFGRAALANISCELYW